MSLSDGGVGLLPRQLPRLLEPLKAAGEAAPVVAVLPNEQAVLN